MNAYKQDERARTVDGVGRRPAPAPNHVHPPVHERPVHEKPLHEKPSPAGSVSTALHSSRRVRLLMALALIVVCGVAAPAIALTMTPKPTRALEAVIDLPPGSVVTAADLTTVDASGPSGALMPAADQGSIIGQTVRVEVPAGALLDAADLGAFPPTGSTVVPVAVKPGQYPVNLAPGETVAVFPISNGAAASTTTASHAAATGTVTQISAASGDGSGEVVVDLEVTTGQAAVVAQAPAVVLVGLDARGDAP
jgi:hypothetical protein